MAETKTTPIVERLNQVIANKDAAGQWDLLIRTNPSDFTLYDYYAFGRASRLLDSETWHEFMQVMTGGVRRLELELMSFQIGEADANLEAGPLVPDRNRKDYGTAMFIARQHPDQDVRAAAQRVAAHLEQQYCEKYGISQETVIKTTPVIDQLNDALEREDRSALWQLLISSDKSHFTHLDLLAIGRVNGRDLGHKYGHAWLRFNSVVLNGFPAREGSLAPDLRLSFAIGALAGHIDCKGSQDLKREELKKHFGTATLAATEHPDADVRAIADWAAQHVKNELRAEYGLGV